MTAGLTMTVKPTHRGEGEYVATFRTPAGQVVARIVADPQMATCSCDWPVEEGKCLHLLLLQRHERRELEPDWPAGRGGKTWAWEHTTRQED